METSYEGPEHFNPYAIGGRPLKFECAYCGTSGVGWIIATYSPVPGRGEGSGPTPKVRPAVRFVLCTICGRGTIVDLTGTQYPGPKIGDRILGLKPEIEEAYEEVRNCFSVNAFTAGELMCRNILMYVACEKGADEGKGFVEYVDYLVEKGYVTPQMRPWVKRIRDLGSLAAHRLEASPPERAYDTFTFTAQMLRLIYEMEELERKYARGGEKPESKD